MRLLLIFVMGVACMAPAWAAPVQPTVAQAALLAKMAALDAREDRLARCLAYPDPPGVSWNHAELGLFCHMQFEKGPSVADVQARFDRDGADGLDRYFDGLRKAQHDVGTAWKLDEAFANVFGCVCLASRALADAWVAQAPESAWAHAASGYAYGNAAAKARGTEFIDKTPPARIQQMDALDHLAATHLHEALAKDGDLSPAVSAQLWIKARHGTPDAHDELVDALRKFPTNLSIHNVAAALYQQKWVGLSHDLEAEGEHARALSTRNPLLLLTASYIEWTLRRPDDGHWSMSQLQGVNEVGPSLPVFREIIKLDLAAGDAPGAAIYASEVLRFSPTTEVATRTWRARARWMMGDRKGAIADCDRALVDRPGYGEAQALRKEILAAR